MKLWSAFATFFVALFLCGCIINYVDVGSMFKVQPLQETRVSGKGKAKILIIDLSGVINEEQEGGVFPEPNMVSRFKEELNKAADDAAVRAVVIRVNSPGGTVTASDIMYHEVREFKKRTGKKVIASIVDVGASGAYYISMAADRVVAHPTAITGSIGVIMLHVNVEGLLEKIGVSSEAIKSGPHKDMGSPLKPLAPEDRELLQGIINQMYGRFLTVVQDGRPKLAPEKVRELADGRVYTADQALESGLVDEVGYLDQALNDAKQMAGVSEARVIMYARPQQSKETVYAQASSILNRPGIHFDPTKLLDLKSPKFMYLWMP